MGSLASVMDSQSFFFCLRDLVYPPPTKTSRLDRTNLPFVKLNDFIEMEKFLHTYTPFILETLRTSFRLEYVTRLMDTSLIGRIHELNVFYLIFLNTPINSDT